MLLQQRLTELMEQKGFNQSYVCRSTGISDSKLSQWLKGNYKGDNQKINEAVESFINREISKNSIFKNTIPVKETSIYLTVTETTRNCHYKSELGVIFGDAGLGKTTAIEKYAEENPDVIFIKANPSYTKKYLMQEIHKKIGCEGFGAIYTMLNDIISKLKNSGRLIIVDQAEYLQQSSLELLRTIHDEAKIGLLLVGMPKLYYNLKGKKGDFRQLFTRIGYKIKLENLKPEDTELLANAMMPEITASLCDSFHSVALGNTRALTMLLKRSLEVAALNGINPGDINPRMIKEVGDKLLVIEG